MENYELFTTPEGIYAKEHFCTDEGMSFEKRKEELLSYATDTVVSGRVVHKTQAYAIVSLGAGVVGCLTGYQAVVNGSSGFFASLCKDSYINCQIIEFDEEKNGFKLSRRKIVERSVEFHRAEYIPGRIVKTRVLSVYQAAAKVDIGAGDIGYIHTREIFEKKYIANLADYFAVGQTLDAVVRNFDERYSCYELGFRKIPQHGLKIDSVVEAFVIDMSEKMCKCSFPDFPDSPNGVVTSFPQHYKVKFGDRFPVTVVGFKFGMPICKF